jgi:hypothetical protein
MKCITYQLSFCFVECITCIYSLTDVFWFVIYIDMWTVSLTCLFVWCIRINCLTNKFWCVTCVGTSPVSFRSTEIIFNSCSFYNIHFFGELIVVLTSIFISSDYCLQVFIHPYIFTYIFTYIYLLNLWSRVFLEKLTVSPQLIKKSSTFYRYRSLIASFTTDNSLSLFLARLAMCVCVCVCVCVC